MRVSGLARTHVCRATFAAFMLRGQRWFADCCLHRPLFLRSPTLSTRCARRINNHFEELCSKSFAAGSWYVTSLCVRPLMFIVTPAGR